MDGMKERENVYKHKKVALCKWGRGCINVKWCTNAQIVHQGQMLDWCTNDAQMRNNEWTDELCING